MAHVSLADLVHDLGEALEAELDSIVRLVRRSASFAASRGAEGVRLSVELSPVHGEEGAAVEDPSGELLREELQTALQALENAAEEKASLEARLVEAERARQKTNAALTRLRARLKELDEGARESRDLESGAQIANAELEAAISRERIARTAAEASLAMLEREHQALRNDLADSREARQLGDEALAESRQLNADLQSELAEVWRLLRETRPGDPLAITLDVSDADRRQNVERVQAKIIDAREIFKRRRNRWPVAI